MYIAHLLIAATGGNSLSFQAVSCGIIPAYPAKTNLGSILYPALPGALGVLKEELAEPFVHVVYYVSKRGELAVHSLGNVGRKLGQNGLVPRKVRKAVLTTEVSNMPRRVKPINDEVESAQSLCYG